MENTRSVFMDLADKFISRIKEKIREEAIPKKIKKIFELSIPNETSNDGHNETPLSVSSTQNNFYSHKLPFEKENSHAYTVTYKSLKPTLMHRVSMISQTKPITHKTSFQHSNFKTPTLHFFDESKFEYEDEDEVEIKKMGTGMDEEPLEHTIHENGKSSNLCHKNLLTSNPPIKPKDSGNIKIKVVDSKPCVVEANIGVNHDLTYLHHPFMSDYKKHYGFKPGLLGQDGFQTRSLSMLIENDPFLGENFNSPIDQSELGKVMMKGAHLFEHTIHSPLFPHEAYFHPKGVYRYFHPHLILSVGKTSPIFVK